MATSMVEKAKEQIESEKQNKVVMGKEPEQQIEDEQWEFIRDKYPGYLILGILFTRFK